MNKRTKIYVGKAITINVGTRVTRAGVTYTRQQSSIATVVSQRITRSGTRVYWKSHGVMASTLVK